MEKCWCDLKGLDKFTKKEIAVCKYMDLRIKGFGAGLSEEELDILRNLSDDEWKEINLAIRELGELTAEDEAGSVRLIIV